MYTADLLIQVFELLTGNGLVTSPGTTEERLAHIQHVLQDSILHQRLKVALRDEEAMAAAVFLKKCLAIDPKRRRSSEKLLLYDEWVKEGGQCSCCHH